MVNCTLISLYFFGGRKGRKRNLTGHFLQGYNLESENRTMVLFEERIWYITWKIGK